MNYAWHKICKSPSFPGPARSRKDKRMKTKQITAMLALGSSLAIVQPCIAGPEVVTPAPQVYPATKDPATQVPTSYVWDGSEYVGQVGSKYYYLGPRNTWVNLDSTRQERFQHWQKSNPDWQSHEIRNTRYQGHDMGQSHPTEANPPSHENPHSP
jgi:hypothetical protein